MASDTRKARYDVSSEVKDAMERGDWAEVARIISECSRRDADSVMTQLVSRDQWDAVKQVIRCVGDEDRTWDIAGVSVKNNILLSVAEGNWWRIGEMPHERFLHSTLEWIVQQACTRAKQTDIVQYVLPHCEDDQLDNVLQQSVIKSQWLVAGKILQRDVLNEQLKWVMEEACRRANQSDIVNELLPQCPDSLLPAVLRELVSRGLWYAAGQVMGMDISDTLLCWAVVEACRKAEVSQIKDHMLPHCNPDHLNCVMRDLVTWCEWKCVKQLLTCVEHAITRWSIDGLCIGSSLIHSIANHEWNNIISFLRHCIDYSQQFLAVLQSEAHETKNRFPFFVRSEDGEIKPVFLHLHPSIWKAKFPSYVTDLQEVTVVVCQTGVKNIVYLVPRCANGKLDIVFRHVLLHLESSKENVCPFPNTWEIYKIVINRENTDITAKWLSLTTNDKIANILRRLITESAWWALGKVLLQNADDAILTSILNTLTCDGDTFLEDIISICNDAQTDFIMGTMICKGQWASMATLLSLTRYRKLVWTIEGVKVETAMLHILREGNRGRVVTTIQGRDSPQIKWLIHTVCLHAPETDLTVYILPPCADDQLDSVLTTLVERRLWRAVRYVLKRGVSDSNKRCAVEKTCQHCDVQDSYVLRDILPHCADDQLDYVLTTLVERRLWESVQYVLRRIARDLSKDLAGQKTCDHCRSAGVYFSKYRVHDSDSLVNNSCTSHCANGNLDSPTSAAFTTKDECTAVRNVSGPVVSDAQRRQNIQAAFHHADEDTLIEILLPHYVYDSIHSALKTLASRRFWTAFLVLLHNSIIDTLYIWAAAKDTESKDEVFLDVLRNPCDGAKDLTPAMWRSVTWSRLKRSLKQLLDWQTPLCEVLCKSLLAIARELWLSGREKEIDDQEHTVTMEASSTVEHLHQLLMECKTHHVSDLLSCTEGLQHEYSKRKSGTCFLLQLYFIKNLVHQYNKRKAWTQMTDAILIVLTTVPVAPDVQSAALRVMLRHKRWDVISHACLLGVCEQDRRQLFQAAVKQRQWSAVKRWADHTLYDDQRLWALGEARQEKRWDVYLKLADHGLSEWERVGVLFRVTMHADLTLVHHMLTTVADVTDMIDLLTNTPGVVSKLGVKNKERRMNDLKVFENNLMKDTHTLKTLKTRATRGKWWVVLHNNRHKPNLKHARRALKAAVSSEAWHAVIQLVKLETDVTRRDSLFRDMVRLRQWAVCRDLLELGVSHKLSLELLSEFFEDCQWTLVAMAMECTMGDDRRKKIMHHAIMMREGSVVWECVIKLQTRLSVDEREELFQLAFNREVWQAVKPLIEETDGTGIKHRDTALLEAIEQHQWDVVDHCQRHHADINMKDDDGHTPIHRAARKGDWEAVKELTVRDGDPNLLDSKGLSVLHRAIRAKQWDAVKLLIQFHGDIHQAAQYRKSTIDSKTRTPLQLLIDARQGEVIELSLMWCPDQQKVVNGKRETVLHAVCLSGWPDTLYHLIARKVDPLAVTWTGLTALCYAVLCKDCPQRMVAECVTLGFSTHQPHITRTARIDMSLRSNFLTEEEHRLLLSPLVLAVMRGLPVVPQMLCEAGACSSRQLFELNVRLVELTKPNTDEGWDFRRAFCEVWKYVHKLRYRDPDYSLDAELMEQSADYLRQVSSTPRSLVSTCRLVISRCLTLSKTRHRDIAQLPLSPMMKDYLMFSDFTDPRYPDLSYRGKE